MRVPKIDAIREFILTGDYTAPPGSVAFERELKDWCDQKGYNVQGFGRNIQRNNDFNSAQNTRNLIIKDRQLRTMNHKQQWFDDPGYDDVMDGPYNPFKAIKYDIGGGAFGMGGKPRQAGAQRQGRKTAGQGGGNSSVSPRLSGAVVAIVAGLAVVGYLLRNQLAGLIGGLIPILVLVGLVLAVVRIVPRLIRKEVQFSFLFIALILFIVGINGHLAGVGSFPRAVCLIVALLLLAFA